jgi:hypothetical protein
LLLLLLLAVLEVLLAAVWEPGLCCKSCVCCCDCDGDCGWAAEVWRRRNGDDGDDGDDG